MVYGWWRVWGGAAYFSGNSHNLTIIRLQHANADTCKQVGSPVCSLSSSVLCVCLSNCFRFVAAFAVTFWIIWHFACLWLVSLSRKNSFSPLSGRFLLSFACSLLTHYFEINVASFARQARVSTSFDNPTFCLFLFRCLSRILPVFWLSAGSSLSH